MHAPAEVIKANTNLKVIGNVGSCFNNTAIEEANKHGIAVTDMLVHESAASTGELAYS